MKPLYQSLRDGDESEVVQACANAATLDEILKLMPTMHDDTILHMAIYMGKESIALRIIEVNTHEELITKPNKFGNTALHEAAAAGCVRVVKKLLEKAPGLLFTPNKKREMPLYTAAHFGQREIFKSLAEKLNNIDPQKNELNDIDPHRLDPRLHFCSPHRNFDDDPKILFSQRQSIRTTILHAAIRAESFELALLIAKKREYVKTFQIMDEDSKTPLHLLSSNSSAFESGMKCGPIKRFIYNCAPYEDAKEVKEHDAHEQQYSSDDSSKGSDTLFHRLRRVLSSVNRSVWVVLRAWSSMRNIYEERKRHGLASELASVLILSDRSWDLARQYTTEEQTNDIASQQPFLNQDSDHLAGETTDPSLKKTPPIPLYIATEHGIFEIVKEILTVHKAAYEYRNNMNQNILHLSIMHRQWKIFNFVIQMDETKKRLIRQLDTHNFTVLHHVGNIDYYKGGTQPGPAFQLQEELKWFEDVKELMPRHYQKFGAREKENDKDKDTTLESSTRFESIDVDKKITPDSADQTESERDKEKTPMEYFRGTHDPHLKKAREWLKRTSESCSTVAGLMATVAFTAAFTVPGGNDEQSGTPLLLHSPFFTTRFRAFGHGRFSVPMHAFGHGFRINNYVGTKNLSGSVCTVSILRFQIFGRDLDVRRTLCTSYSLSPL